MKTLKAQQITEFMLAVPLLIAFFVILTEFAFAFNTQLVLSNTLKSSVSSYGYKMSDVNRNYSYPNGNDIKAYVIENLKAMKLDESKLDVQFITIEENPVVVASYEYKPDFTFVFLPALKTINMSAVAVFPYTFRDFDGYDRGINPASSEINYKKSYDYQPICKPCYVSECDGWSTVYEAIFDKLGVIIGYNSYDVCVSMCSRYQGDWWCVDDPEKECEKDLGGTNKAEHNICH